ncbi:MAG: tRNA threonylcarbamoyladenosine dehydratase [Sphaerochaeta sp.]
MDDQFERTRMIFGMTRMEKLYSSRVIVFGIGGVGGFAAEALVRSGIGALDIVDNDTVSLSNLNRQIIALHSTLGRAKVDVARERFLDINPSCEITSHRVFLTPETASSFDFSKYDYVVDCIDNVTGKIEIIMRSQAIGVPIISSMGAGNKISPSLLKVADIYKTSVCPLARVMRFELRKRGVKSLKCVFSTEEPVSSSDEVSSDVGKRVPGSSSFVPSSAGLLIASEVIRDLTGYGR